MAYTSVDVLIMRIEKIVSGGQTGVDRGALDAALALGMSHGGWCPLGRLAEDGRIPDRYALCETASEDYAVRTERNVVDSDGTLVLSIGEPSGGTALTCRLARQHGRPLLLVDLTRPLDAVAVRRWIEESDVAVLNVAGPRESAHPGVQIRACNYLLDVLAGMANA